MYGNNTMSQLDLSATLDTVQSSSSDKNFEAETALEAMRRKKREDEEILLAIEASKNDMTPAERVGPFDDISSVDVTTPNYHGMPLDMGPFPYDPSSQATLSPSSTQPLDRHNQSPSQPTQKVGDPYDDLGKAFSSQMLNTTALGNAVSESQLKRLEQQERETARQHPLDSVSPPFFNSEARLFSEVPDPLLARGTSGATNTAQSKLPQPLRTAPVWNPFGNQQLEHSTESGSVIASASASKSPEIERPATVGAFTAQSKQQSISPPARQQSAPASHVIPRPESTVSISTVSSSTTLVPSIPFGDPHARLDSFFDDRITYSDSEILEISSLLKHSYNENAWNKVPRTYIVLRAIGQLDVLDRFIELGFSDEWFPVTSRTLPQILNASTRDEFVNAQDRILTKSIDLEKGVGGRHRHFAKGEPVPFKSVSILGSGNFGQVDRVVSLISYKEYARKCIPRRTMFGLKTAAAMKLFSDEVSVLKRLKHRHMVEFIGSYTDAKYLALLMSPVAEMDLDKYLQAMAESRAAELRTFFGCLATALHYLHDNDIRHKVSLARTGT
jgi:hypothetical protein